MALGMAVAACSPDDVAAPQAQSPTATLGRVTVSPMAAVLAVNGTQQFSVQTLSLAGTALSSVDSVRYYFVTPSDSVNIRIDPNGLATALGTTALDVRVNVVAFQGKTSRGEHILLKVTPTAVAGVQLVLQPSTTALAKGSVATITPLLRNPVTMATVASPAVRYSVNPADLSVLGVFTPGIYLQRGNSFLSVREPPSVNPVATLTQNQVLALAGEGGAWVYASVSAYGTLLQDSVRYTFAYPSTATVQTLRTNLAISNAFAGQTLYVAPGATVTFSNGIGVADALQIAYTFDNPTAATVATPPSTIGGSTGNITALSASQSSARRFLAPGTYKWTATASGGVAPWTGQSISGTIVVK